MATKLWHVPVRLATGAIILDQGLLKLDADEDTAKWLHGQAAVAFPSSPRWSPRSSCGCCRPPRSPSGRRCWGSGSSPPAWPAWPSACSGSLTRLYLRAPGTRREGTIAPSQQGITLAKDSWMLAIGTALVLDALFGSGRKRKKSS